MARRSSSSSSAKGNGHATASANAERVLPIREYTEDDSDYESPQYEAVTKPFPVDPSLLPTGNRSLSSIGLQAFFLGFTLATSLLSMSYLAIHGNALWRLPSFFACLSLFHFLEYWTTAHFNQPVVRSDSFLLFNNGTAYNIAHTLSALEIVISNWIRTYQSLYVNRYTITIGITLVVTGQLVRSAAMAQAGTNFNHMPQKVRKQGHELVTGGVYAWLRHPSYFGFFWWALGTQVLVGNKICLIGYLLVLWNFFRLRITGRFGSNCSSSPDANNLYSRGKEPDCLLRK